MHPSKRNVAANSLGEVQVQINIRKVRVNAQVTAVIAFIEVISNVIVVIFVWITVRTTHLSMIQALALYMVVIPYIFLMNTSHNKNRVVEYGWGNVLQNVFRRGHVQKVSHAEDSDNNPRIPHKKGTLNTISGKDVPDRELTRVFSANIANDDTGVLESAIYNSFDPEPSTSKVTLTYQNTPMTLVGQMIQNIEDEEQYMKYFKSLLAYQEDRKNGTLPSEFDLEKEFAIQHISETENKGKGKRSKHNQTPYNANKECDVSYHNCEIDLRIQRNVTSKRKNDEVSILRKRVLDNIVSLNVTDSSLDDLVEELIDIEENFME